MLQLKRTADIASPNEQPHDRSTAEKMKKVDKDGDFRMEGGSQPRLKALLDVALQSGKAARDPGILPGIIPLKKYGSGGSSSRYSLGEVPTDLSDEAAKVWCFFPSFRIRDSTHSCTFSHKIHLEFVYYALCMIIYVIL